MRGSCCPWNSSPTSLLMELESTRGHCWRRIYHHGKTCRSPSNSVLPRMQIGDRLAIVKTIVEYQKAWSSISFEQYGSLYFAQDLDGNTQPLRYKDESGIEVTNSRFSIGPSTSHKSVDDERMTIEFDRGPCKLNSLNLFLL